MPVTGIDHLAFPTDDGERLAAFYASVGFTIEDLDEWRAGTMPLFSIAAGNQKINVHPETMTPLRGNPWYLRGDTAVAGSADLCVVWEGGIDAAIAMLAANGVEPIEGPVPRIGGRAGGTTVGISVYVRDPDHNLLEFISYEPDDVERYQRDQIAR